MAFVTRGVKALKEVHRAEATLSGENLSVALCAEHGVGSGLVSVTHGALVPKLSESEDVNGGRVHNVLGEPAALILRSWHSG